MIIVSLFVFQPQQVVQEKPAQVCQMKSLHHIINIAGGHAYIYIYTVYIYMILKAQLARRGWQLAEAYWGWLCKEEDLLFGFTKSSKTQSEWKGGIILVWWETCLVKANVNPIALCVESQSSLVSSPHRWICNLADRISFEELPLFSSLVKIPSAY